MHSQKIISHQGSMGSHLRCKQKIRQDTLNTNCSNDSKNEHANQGTRMTLQVKPQANIPVSTYYQEAFVSPFAANRILEQKKQQIDNQTDNLAPRREYAGGLQSQYFYHCYYLYYKNSRRVCIRL